MFLTIETSDGAHETIELEGPGGLLRMAVGKPGRRSGVWRIWAGKTRPDIYIKCRDAGELKISLHESGEWHHAWESADLALEHTGKSKRFIDLWTRPAPVRPGWTHAFSIRIPGAYMVDQPGDQQRRAGILWLPEPPVTDSMGIHIFIGVPDQEGLPLTDSFPLGGFTLADGSAVLVLVSRHTLTPTEWDLLRSHHSSAAKEFPDFGAGGAPRAGLYITDDATGDRSALDIALFPERTDHAPAAPAPT